jgi:hypothetical protein
MEREYVRVLEAGRQLDLVLEAPRAERRRELGMEDLERYEPVVLEIAGEVDRGHAAPPELLLEQVSVGQSGFEMIYSTSQC